MPMDAFVHLTLEEEVEMHTNDTRELGAHELDQVAGGINFGPIHISWSEGARAIDIGVGNTSFYIGPNGMGWCAGDRWGQIKFKFN